MSSSVESRIVTMRFDNAQFQQGASTTLSTLDKLKQAMSFSNVGKGLGAVQSVFSKFTKLNPFSGATKGVEDMNTKSSIFARLNPFGKAVSGAAELQRSTQMVNFSTLEGGVTSVSNKFLALSTIAITTLSNITNRAINAGTTFAKQFTTAPISAGLQEYETNLNSIQTILANTQVSGAGLPEVNKALQELNTYSDKTIYNFSEMARNIGTFTAAGVDLDTATSSIKGIANLAALSGSNSQQASTAMYQLSQEIASGRVSLMGWNSVVNAGMGGSTFQRALVQTAQKMGTLSGKTVEFKGKMKNASIDGKSFRDSIMAKPGEQSWLTSDVLTKTLGHLTGDMTDAQLAAEGFSKAQIKAIQQQAKTAVNAATKVKTLTGVIDTAKEVAGSGWAKTWQYVFGDFKEARKSFTGASNAINQLITNSSNARNSVLKSWKAMGGRNVAIQAIGIAFRSILKVLGAVKEGFRDVFPKTTGKDLFELTHNFRVLMANLVPSEKTLANISRIAAGVFSVFSIGWQIIKAAAGAFKDLFTSVGGGGGGFLSFVAVIGDMLVALDSAIKKSGIFKSIFAGLVAVIKIPLALLGKIGDVLGNLFSSLDSSGVDKVGNALDGAGKRLQPVADAGERVAAVFAKITAFAADMAGKVVDAMSSVGEAVGSAFTSENIGHALDALNAGLLGGILILLKNFSSGGLVKIDAGGGLFDSIKGTLNGVTESMQTMQTNLKADIILKIAAALGIMALSLTLLATLDPKRLAAALAAMGAGFIGLQAALKVLATIGFKATAKLPFLTASILALAASMIIFSVAIKIMSTIPFGDLLKGLGGMAAMLFILTKAIGPLAANSGGMVRAGAGLILLGVALNIMALALKSFASMSLVDMAKGMVGVAGSLGILAAAMKVMPRDMLAQSAALLILGVALNAIALAVKSFAGLGWADMVKGFTGVAVSLGIMAAAMRLMPQNMLVQAAALVVLGTALNIIGLAVKTMGGMSVETIAKGLITLAASLGILAAGLYLMSGTLAGAAALVIAAGALTLLVPVLLALGAMTWQAIAQGLTMLAGTFLVVGLAGLAIGAVILPLTAFSLILLTMGAGLALAGAGALAFATAFGIVVAAGAAGAAVLSGILGVIIQSIPKALQAFGEGIVKFAQAIGKGAPAFFQAFSRILAAIINAITSNIPKVGAMFLRLLQMALNVISNGIPRIISVGIRLIVSFLNAINKNIGKIVNIAASIIVKFINGIASNIGKIVQSAINLILKFINALTSAIDRNSSKLGTAGGKLAVALVRGLVNGLGNAVQEVVNAAANLAAKAIQAIKDKAKIFSPSKVTTELGEFLAKGLANGMGNGENGVARSSQRVGQAAMDALRSTMSGVGSLGAVDMDISPTITPVLDLTHVNRDASKMDDLLQGPKLQPGVSFKRAFAISQDRKAQAFSALRDHEKQQTVKEIKFEQHNHSPKAISPVETYRNTRSQLSFAKEALKTA